MEPLSWQVENRSVYAGKTAFGLRGLLRSIPGARPPSSQPAKLAAHPRLPGQHLTASPTALLTGASLDLTRKCAVLVAA